MTKKHNKSGRRNNAHGLQAKIMAAGTPVPKFKRILHVQVIGQATQEQLQEIGTAFAQAKAGEESSVVTTQGNVQCYNITVAPDAQIDAIVVNPVLTAADIARVVHQVNRGYAQSIGETVPAWEEAEQDQRDSIFRGVLLKLRSPDLTAEQQHEAWYTDKIADGWTYGEAKDVANKVHHCLVPYAELPVAQRAKDFLFASVVDSLKSKLPAPSPIVRQIEICEHKFGDNEKKAINSLTWRSAPFTDVRTGDLFRMPDQPRAIHRAISDPYIDYSVGAEYKVDIEQLTVTDEPDVPNADTVAAIEESRTLEAEKQTALEVPKFDAQDVEFKEERADELPLDAHEDIVVPEVIPEPTGCDTGLSADD
jgi:hypothetical protein